MSYVENCDKHGQYHADYICGDCFVDLKAENTKLASQVGRLRAYLHDISFSCAYDSGTTIAWIERLSREALEEK